ncbi:MAG: peptide chain release factor N(5)-glutamine methyltransferase [Verrucomicrobiota bacterium]|nr:peptide chain release factor N(5)-glutamine methyltransferase [Verrucomicrobiota bacterium]
MKIKKLYNEICKILQAAYPLDYESKAELLFCHVLNCSKSELILREYEKIIPSKKIKLIQEYCTCCIKGEPIQYICGKTEFYGIEIQVGPGVLIPRPETELLIDEVLKIYNGKGNILDICTGSGAIALALAKKIKPSTKIIASDISTNALKYAEINKKLLRTPQITLLQSNLFDSISNKQKFTIITANPPYVTEKEYKKLNKTIKDYEPQNALVAGFDGLNILRKIAESAKAYLNVDGTLICEIGGYQGEDVKRIFQKYYKNTQIIKDYNGLDRIVRGTLSPASATV